jgi:phosphatidylserine/phosphatidylglycerophosphate/cardiolipin synthase-like enzyme
LKNALSVIFIKKLLALFQEKLYNKLTINHLYNIIMTENIVPTTRNTFNIHSPAFGEHCCEGTKNHIKLSKTVHKIALSLLLGSTISTAALTLTPVIVPISGIWIMSALATSLTLLASTAVTSVIKRRAIYSTIGILSADPIGIRPKAFSKSYNSKCQLFPTFHTKQSFEWKKRLIENAQHNITLSGNYCGGESFDEILDIIKQQLELKPDLKVVILSSDHFITKKNHEKIDFLQNAYPDNFSLVETPVRWFFNPWVKKVTNHTKALVIDYGKYFIMGGSGIEDKYAYAKGIGDRGHIQKPTPKEAASAPQRQNTLTASCFSRIVNSFLPRGFRDMDFVGKSELSEEDSSLPFAGKAIYDQLMKLAFRWERLQHYSTSSDTRSHKKTLIHNLIEKKSPETWSSYQTEIPEFEEAKSEAVTFMKGKEPYDTTLDVKPSTASIECYATGPEHKENPFLQRIINLLDNAKEKIHIGHMYFHPPKSLLQALARAADRGVKIVLVTNGNEKYSPTAHKVFGERNRYNYMSLYKLVKPGNRENITVYEYGNKHDDTPRKTTYHKKVIVVDDAVIVSSGNIGYKSLQSMSDHELNIIATSSEFARDTIKVIESDYKIRVTGLGIRKVTNSTTGRTKKIKDKPLPNQEIAKKISLDKVHLTIRQYISAYQHKMLAFRIG